MKSVDILSIIEDVERESSGSVGRFTLSNQRIRNLTTGILHTDLNDVLTDLKKICGPGMTSPLSIELSRKAVLPWLRAQGLDDRFWIKRRDTTHTGSTRLTIPTASDRAEIKDRIANRIR